MEDSISAAVTLLEAHNAEAFLFLLGLNIILLTAFIALLIRSSKLNKSFKLFMQGSDAKSLEEKIDTAIKLSEKNSSAAVNIQEEISSIKKDAKLNLKKVGIIRYNAFSDMGSDMSYAVAILDDYGSGVVMSSIYGREDFRAFAKPVVECESKHRLSEEEQKAISKAMQNN